MGLPIDVGQWWGHWGSRRTTAEYMPRPPNFIFTHECALPWPFGHQKVKRKTFTTYDLWPPSIIEYFTKEPPPARPTGESTAGVGTKRPRGDVPAGGDVVKTGEGVRGTTRCQRKNVPAGDSGVRGGKDMEIVVD